MQHLYEIIFYQPILNLLVFLYNHASFKDFGIAIILLTIIIRLILWPLSQKSIKAQKDLQDLQPKIKDIKERFKDDKQAQAMATMQLYKDHKINPLSSCLPLLIQLPFLIAVFNVFRDGLTEKLSLLYSFVQKPEAINFIAFGFLDLSKPNIYLAVLAGAAQFWQAKMMLAKRPELKTPGAADEDMAAIMSKQMTYLMPVMTIFIGVTLPGGLTFYWFLVTVLTALQQLMIIKTSKPLKPVVVEGELVK
jgi:YidC/Oxa1 family membrane protein insertase